MTETDPIRDALRVDVAMRLGRARTALAMSQTDFAARAGLTQAAYNHYETGVRLLSVPAAVKLNAAYGLSLDWIYRGDPSGLPLRVVKMMRTNDEPL